MKEFLKDKNKRFVLIAIVVVPILIVSVILGINVYKDVKSIMSLAGSSGDASEVNVSNDHKITTMNYVLRDNETDYQFELFAELKKVIESGEATDEEIAKLVAENFVCDYFTWSNKAGQYDVGGMYFFNKIYRENFYTYSRDGFYKYINNYIDNYGSENLLQVANIEANVSKASELFPMTREYSHDIDDYTQEIEKVTTEYTAYDVSLKWEYVKETSFSTTSYPTSIKVRVIKNTDDARFEVVMIGDDFAKTANTEEGAA